MESWKRMREHPALLSLSPRRNTQLKWVHPRGAYPVLSMSCRNSLCTHISSLSIASVRRLCIGNDSTRVLSPVFGETTLDPCGWVENFDGSSSSLSLIGFDCLLPSILLEFGYEPALRDWGRMKSGRNVGRDAEMTESDPSIRLHMNTGDV